MGENGMAKERSAGGRTTTKARTSAAKRKNSPGNRDEELGYEVRSEIKVIAAAAVAVFLFLCNFRICGAFGNVISDVMFGIFGITAYAVPVVCFIASAILISNGGSFAAIRKVISGVVLLILVAMAAELVSGRPQGYTSYDIRQIYQAAVNSRNGGGVTGGSLSYLSYRALSTAGSIILIVVLAVIAAVVFTEKTFVGGLKNGGLRFWERAGEEAELYLERRQERRDRDAVRRNEILQEKQERARERAQRKQELLEEREEERRRREEQIETEKILRKDRKVSGVMLDTELKGDDDGYLDDDDENIVRENQADSQTESNIRRAVYIPGVQTSNDMHEIRYTPGDDEDDYQEEDGEPYEEDEQYEEEPLREEREEIRFVPVRGQLKETTPDIPVHAAHIEPEMSGEYRVHTTSYVSKKEAEKPQEKEKSGKKPGKPYTFPPVKLLHKGEAAKGDSAKTLRETAVKLQETLETFNVRATVTDISQGPSVTRYELQPEAGVKVRKIVDLADDIKMYLAATDIRIEAPIPGKSAVGIEVPNKENTPVALRDLIESEDFKTSRSRLTVAIGKDIAGKTVITNLASMPHLLIAGATGSGKSVCINTIIMSLLYKATPDEVRMIMIDPKIVELSVYNGIPHLLVPVVTDPRKAAAALSWAVAEMTRRYKQFADAKVRDLAGYNTWCDENGDAASRMPEIVVIVDELADLMMQFRNEVEDSIVRLTQLARAAGIYLIIATQRPSVDVITGLIKANIPSRIAFAVSSGVDSRTILDSVGAEKLIGKGDMLFFPRGKNKPARVQGAFVSDEEVQTVTDFVRSQYVETEYGRDVQEEMSGMVVSGSQGGGSLSGSFDTGSDDGAGGYDEYFEQAGYFIIEKEKASIGMLQRAYNIGFNRAARIMDQLSDAGVVGDEEGTKPRRILMNKEQFAQLLAQRKA